MKSKTSGRVGTIGNTKICAYFRHVVLLGLVAGGCGRSGGGPPGQSAPDPVPAPAPAPSAPDGPPPPAGGTAAPAAGTAAPAGFLLADHAAAGAFAAIPSTWRDRAKGLRVLYGTLSHGSQILHGITLIGEQAGAWKVDRRWMKTLYGAVEPRKDNQALYVDAIRAALRASAYDVVMYSWSGGIGRAEDIPGSVEDYYLAPMQALEKEFPRTRFVYFTGPARGDVAAARSRTIREFARARGKALFDFEAIDTHDPSGALRGGSDRCDWCDDWCARNDCSPAQPPANAACATECTRCKEWAHTHCFNCLRKAQAFWWLMARIAGWPGA